MRLVHAADLHLGFRHGTRDTKGGDSAVVLLGESMAKNQREADVEAAFEALVTKVIALQPDAIVIGGDVFHTAQPSNGAIIFAVTQFTRLVTALPGRPIVIACGNHDLPRTRDTAVILGLLEPLGIRVATHDPVWFDFPEQDLAVLAWPESPAVRGKPIPRPMANRRFNVLCLHGEVHGMPMVKGDRYGVEIGVDEIEPQEWSYVALGHWHVHHEIRPNCWYSGSIGYTSSNIWGERKQEQRLGVPGKGFVEHNLATGEHTFHALPIVRDILDIQLSADGRTGAELTQLIRDEVHPDEAIVRVVVNDCLKDTQSGVDSKMIREFKKRAVSFQIDYRRPEVITAGSTIRSVRSRGTLEEIVGEFFVNRQWPADISLEGITKLNQGYMDRAKGDGPMLTPAQEVAV